MNYSGATGISQNNAFFNAALDILTYGIGSGGFRPFCAAQDIVSHEYGHGFTAHTSGLIYRNQSGALNESISDALGFFVEFENQDDWNWMQGEDVHINGIASRSFMNPPSFGDPDHEIGHWWMGLKKLGDPIPGSYGIHGVNAGKVNEFYKKNFDWRNGSAGCPNIQEWYLHFLGKVLPIGTKVNIVSKDKWDKNLDLTQAASAA